MNEALTYGLLGGVVLLSGILVFGLRKQIQSSIKLLLSFSGAYLLAICFLHLVPEIYSSETTYIGFFILLGFLLQLFLEFLSRGIEHGHVHVHSKHFPWGIFISLCIHALLEGMPLESGLHDHDHVHDHDEGNSLLFGVVLHKIPVTIVLMIMLLKVGLSKGKALLCLLIFASMAPLGAFFNHMFGETLNAAYPGYFSAVLAVVVGMLLHISTTILFEASEGHKFNLLKLASMIIGGTVAYFTL